MAPHHAARAPMAGARAPNRQTPASVLVVLDQPAKEGDTFTLISERNKVQTMSASSGKPLAGEAAGGVMHATLRFAVKSQEKADGGGKPQRYKLIQTRENGAQHTILDWTLSTDLLFADEEAPPANEKQYYHLSTNPTPPTQKFLKSAPVVYADIEVDDPRPADFEEEPSHAR